MRITTKRLLLRPMERNDAAELRRIVTLPEVGRMLFLFPPDWTIAQAETFVEAWRFRGAPPFRLAITTSDGEFIGTVGSGAGEEPEVFYFLDPSSAGQGLASEAVRAFTAETFRRFDPPALRAEVFTDNPASARVLEKLGFRNIGEGMASSAARLEPAPVWHYRLSKEQFKAA